MDIRRGEMVEAELDTLITRRHEKRVESEGELSGSSREDVVHLLGG